MAPPTRPSIFRLQVPPRNLHKLKSFCTVSPVELKPSEVSFTMDYASVHLAGLGDFLLLNAGRSPHRPNKFVDSIFLDATGDDVQLILYYRSRYAEKSGAKSKKLIVSK